ncbi:Myosin light chain kinase, smooth muscle, partial [Stegodyphus mimosarum]
MSGVRSRSKSRERSIESVVPENKLSVVSLKCRSQSTSRDSPQRSDTASKSKLSNFTSHIWKKNEPQNRLPPERTKVEIVLNGNTKLLSKSTDDCRKTRRSFLNRVKIADIFNGQKADDVLNEPVAEPTRKSSGKKCEKIAKDSIRTNGNVCSSPLIKNLPKKEGIINEQSTMQATTRERIMSYLKRLETSSVKPKGVPREQKSHSICDTRLETNAKFLTEQEVPIHSTKRNENEYSFFKFGKFRRRKSSESSKKSSTENIEYDSPGISSQEHKVLNSDSVLTTVSVNGTILKTNDSSDNHSKEQQDLNSSQVTYQISPDMADAILLKDVNSFQHTEISSTNRLSQAETCPPTDAFSLEAKRKYQDINSRTTEINLNTRLNQTENASVDDILSEGKSDFQPINSNIIESSSNNRLDQIENESTQAISLAARNDCNQVSYEITETDSNNRIGDEENTYDNAVSLETEKNIQQLKYEITGICLNDRLDEVKNTSSAIDTETVSDKTIVYSSLQNSEISVTTINKEMKDDTVKDTQNNVPECEAQEVSGTFRTSVSIPSIRVQKTQEQAEEKQDLRSSVQNSTAPTKDCDLNGERQSSRSLHGRKHCRGKIRYSSPLIEEECEVFLDENSSPKTESLESDLQRVSSPVECPARIVKGPQSVTVLRGESVTLAISFNGYPIPKVIWMKGGRVLVGNGRLSILEGREMSVVTVNDVTADDSGKYVVSVENEGGGDSCFASVAVVGFPEPPGGEPNVSDVTDHSLVLSWYGSMYDGGSVVTGYIVEMCSLPERKWHKVASSVNTSCSIQGLSKGQRYIFRVRAENRYGASHPSKESKVICLDDYLQYDTSSDEEPGEDFPTSVEIESGTIFTERFDLKEEVGKGRFGTVYRCVEKSCGRPRAAKIIRCVKMKDKEKVRQEIEIMNRLHHPKLMQVLAAFESGRNMIMVME